MEKTKVNEKEAGDGPFKKKFIKRGRLMKNIVLEHLIKTEHTWEVVVAKLVKRSPPTSAVPIQSLDIS